MAKRPRGDGEDLVDAVYAAPPKEFVAARKRVAAALAAAGRDDEARAVRALRRPTSSVWAVNQLARREPKALGELVALGGRLRAEERRLMRGGDAGALMADARVERQKVAALARRAEKIAAEAGRPSAALERKIAQTLHAAAIGDDATRAALEAGRLTHDLVPPSGFGAPSRSTAELADALAASVAATGASTGASTARPPRAHAKPSHAKATRAKATHAKPAHAADETRAAAAARKLAAAAERKRAAAEQRARRRVEAAARKHQAELGRKLAAAERDVARRRHAAERARHVVEAAEQSLRAAKDALADAEQHAAALRRQLES